MAPLAVAGSFGLALVPSLASASTTAIGSAAGGAGVGAVAPALSARPAASSSQAPSTSAVAPRVQHVRTHTQQATGPNPDLGAGVGFGSASAFGLNVLPQVSGYTTPTGKLSVSVDWGDGQSSSYQNDLNHSFSHEYAGPGTFAVTVTVSDGEGDVSTIALGGQQTWGTEYTPYDPVRILDTRYGLGAPAAPVPAGGTLKLSVFGAGASDKPIPSNAVAVVLNVTATDESANGFLSVYNNETSYGGTVSWPGTSNVNFSAHENLPNLVVVPIGPDGLVDFRNGSSRGSTDIVADIEGYYTATTASRYVSINPARILDTRKGVGTGGKVAKIPANGNITLTVDGAKGSGIPGSGVTALAMNLTAVSGTRNGVITAYPDGQTLPAVSNLNYPAGGTAANLAMVPVGTGGKIVLHNNSAGAVDLIVDAFGYYTTAAVTGASAFEPYTVPFRYMDTREGKWTLPADQPYEVGGSYASTVTGLLFNATVTQPSGNGFLSLYPYDPKTPRAIPATSNVNFLTGQTVSNLSIATLSPVPDTSSQPPTYNFGLYLGGHGAAYIILDEFGQFQSK
ncbi:PKD domain-containing protein [Actinospica durhamensis]|uniref:PKD domain-containing protein n=1 Tax=Actinospica durhamensis TaxID=1508375 RepID=A0A941IV03_9ACTN|nr:PKD domain-containing protein [Actinospica durhamensis]MBR7836261.1 PKD domain-containing protein [Actinospica durhamensis]